MHALLSIAALMTTILDPNWNKKQNMFSDLLLIAQHIILVKHGSSLLLNNVYHQKISSHLDSVKYLFMEGMISGDLLRTYFLSLCSAYFSPSSKLSSIPAARFSLSSLTSGFVNKFRLNWKQHMVTAIPVAANMG